jgi:hypothetical protein
MLVSVQNEQQQNAETAFGTVTLRNWNVLFQEVSTKCSEGLCWNHILAEAVKGNTTVSHGVKWEGARPGRYSHGGYFWSATHFFTEWICSFFVDIVNWYYNDISSHSFQRSRYFRISDLWWPTFSGTGLSLASSLYSCLCVAKLCQASIAVISLCGVWRQWRFSQWDWASCRGWF